MYTEGPLQSHPLPLPQSLARVISLSIPPLTPLTITAAARGGLVVDVDVVDAAVVVDTRRHLAQRIGHDHRALAALQFGAIFSSLLAPLLRVTALNQILRGFVFFCFFFTAHQRLIRDRVGVTCHIVVVAIIGGAIISAAVVGSVRGGGARSVLRGLWMYFDFNLSPRISTDRTSIHRIYIYIRTNKEPFLTGLSISRPRGR